MSLPQFTQTTKLSEGSTTTRQSLIRVINALTTNLQQIFTALTKQVQLNSVVLQNISLVVGTNNVPHTLGRTLTGWKIVRQNGLALIFDRQDTNPNPNNYLVLQSDAAVVVSLELY